MDLPGRYGQMRSFERGRCSKIQRPGPVPVQSRQRPAEGLQLPDDKDRSLSVFLTSHCFPSRRVFAWLCVFPSSFLSVLVGYLQSVAP